jgi:hypothetical protein
MGPMGVQFPHKREKTISPFVADPDPNTTAPAAGDLFPLTARPPYGGLTLATQGNTVFLDFRTAADVPVPAAKATWQTWFFDEQSRVWTNADRVVRAGHVEGWITTDIKGALCFVQVQAVFTIGAATKVIIRMMEV